MPTINFAVSVSGAGIPISTLPITRTGSGTIGLEETLNAAKTGTLTTRTDNTTGTLTMTAGHGLTTGQTIDLYWAGGVRFGVTVGTVATNSVPISSGSGDNLPSAASSITAVVQQSANVLIDGDNTKFLVVAFETVDKSLTTAAHVEFLDASSDQIAEIDLVANIPQFFDIQGGASNPFAGDIITNIKMSQAGSSSTETYTLKIVGVQDASP